ncbi:MAG: adenylate/guanylate cyclase domain-containing protein [Myxococcota bacterium]
MPFALQISSSASWDRLEKLLQERRTPGADKAAVDERIWDLFGEEWAVMFTDLSGFSRAVATFGIIHFLQIIHESWRLLIPCIDRHDGILLKTEADSLLVIFRRPERALSCALAMQEALQAYNVDRSAEEKVLLCVGLGYGKMLRIGEHDVYGAEVNAASKLGEDTAKAGEILVTANVKEAVGQVDEVRFEPIAEIPPGASAAFRAVYKL